MFNILWKCCVVSTICTRLAWSVRMTIQPPVVDLNALAAAGGRAPEVTMTCALSPNETTTANIRRINVVRIARNRVVDQRGHFTDLVMLVAGMQPTLVGRDQDVIDRNPAISGAIQQGDSSNPNSASVQLVWPAGTIRCTDELQGEYRCEMNYLDGTYQEHSVHSVATLHVTTSQPALQLEAVVNGTSLATTGGDNSYKVQIRVGETVTMTCKGNVGSDPYVTIDWYYTHPLDTKDRFHKFLPKPDDVINDGDATFSQSKCSYEKNSTLRYVVSEEDVERKDDLVFECGITLVQDNNQLVVTNSDRRLYIEALRRPLTTTGTNTTRITAASTTALNIPTRATPSTTTPTIPTTPSTPTTTSVKIPAQSTSTTAITTPMTTTVTKLSTAFLASSVPAVQQTTTVRSTNSRDGSYCLSCQSVIQPRKCHTVVQCPGDKVCGTKRVLDQFGDAYFDVGCMAINECHGESGKTGSSCTDCCHGDLCNVHGCGQPGYPDTVGPVCFTCDMLPPGQSCHTITACNKNWVCSIDHVVSEFGDILVNRRCRSHQLCRALNSFNPALVGRRSLQDGGGATRTHCCCSGALCNDVCPTTTTTPTMSTSPHPANMTTTAPLKASATPIPTTAPPKTSTKVHTSKQTKTYTTTAAKTTIHDCFDVLTAEQCQFVVHNIPTVCDNKSVADNGGCLDTCGFCNGTRTTVIPSGTSSRAITRRSFGMIAFRDCLDIHRAHPAVGSGEYSVTVTSADGSPKYLPIWCDMAHRGGWTVFQKRFNGSVDFYKGFKSYEQGFGNVNGEFWLGLEHIYEMTAGTTSTLRVDVVNSAGNHTYEEYSNFSVGQSPLYTLHIGGARSGTADGKLDALNNSAFSASNKDQDALPNSACATRMHGCFWYSDCSQVSNPNGLYKPGPDANCLFHAVTYGNCDGNKAIEMKFKRNV